MTAPGRGSLSGTEGWRNTVRESQARATEIGTTRPIVQDVTEEECRETEDDRPVGDRLEDLSAQPLPAFDHPRLMAGRADMAARAGDCQEIFMAAVFPCHAGTPVVQIAALEIARDHLRDRGPPESVVPGDMLAINPDTGFTLVLDAAGVIRSLRISWTIHGGRSRYAGCLHFEIVRRQRGRHRATDHEPEESRAGHAHRGGRAERVEPGEHATGRPSV